MLRGVMYAVISRLDSQVEQLLRDSIQDPRPVKAKAEETESKLPEDSIRREVQLEALRLPVWLL